ncbi:MAG: ABC transporter ATP-binding protein [Candidatus Thermoplasmatota archaeon]|nr:ABC transporter ATP-binding protein [Candidatus Thermoplasmatota archaeon]
MNIKLEQVTKNYGNVQGISNINLEVSKGITGILGPNGAGKSTTMKIILGLSRPSRGRITVNGKNPFEDWELKKDFGFVPEYDCFYEHMSGLEFVSYFLRMHDFQREEAEKRAREALTELGLEEAMERKINTYSRGMRQKTKVARATVFNPRVLVMDEPFQGADPTTRMLLMKKMTEWAENGKTILISSHILHDIQSLTDNIALINNGKMLAHGNRHEIRNLINIPRPITIVPVKDGNLRKLAKRLLDEKWTKATSIDEDTNELTVETTQTEDVYLEIPKILQKEKITVERIYSEDDSLDSLYAKLVEGHQWT